MSQIEVNLYGWTKIDKAGLVIIIHPDPVRAMNIIKRFKQKLSSFHSGHVFTENPIKYKPDWKDCKHLDNCNTDFLIDLFGQQGGNYPVLPQPTTAQKELINSLEKKKRDLVMKKLKPLHLLPSSVFGPDFPTDLYDRINKCLIIPDTYLIIHHPSPERKETKELFKKKTFRNCVLKTEKPNSLFKIISCSSSKLLPQVYFDRAQLVLCFHRDENELKTISRKTRINTIMRTKKFVETINEYKDKTVGYVIENVKQEIGDTQEFMTIPKLWYTTDRETKTKSPSTSPPLSPPGSPLTLPRFIPIPTSSPSTSPVNSPLSSPVGSPLISSSPIKSFGKLSRKV